MEGPLLLIPKDNLNTESIYGKDYAYRDEMTGRVDFETSEIAVEDRTYPFAPLRDVAQELVALGGLESVLVKRLS